MEDRVIGTSGHRAICNAAKRFRSTDRQLQSVPYIWAGCILDVQNASRRRRRRF